MGDFLPAGYPAKWSFLMHFSVVAKVGGVYCPLAMVAQVPPSDREWMALTKAFIVEKAKLIYEFFSSPKNRCALQAELDAANVVYSIGRSIVGTCGNEKFPGVMTPSDKAVLKKDPYPTRYPFIAYSLLHCVRNGDGHPPDLSAQATMHWSQVHLGTTFDYDNAREQVVIFDVTDLSDISMGVIETYLEGGNRGRHIVTMVEHCQWPDDPPASKTGTNTFPSIPLIDVSVLKLFWNDDVLAKPTESHIRVTVEDVRTLVLRAKNNLRNNADLGLVHIHGITCQMLALSLAHKDLNYVKTLSFASGVFAGPNDENMKLLANVLRVMPHLSAVYIADPPEVVLTENARQRTADVQGAFVQSVTKLGVLVLNNKIFCSAWYASSLAGQPIIKLAPK